jgi:hypothetical protein
MDDSSHLPSGGSGILSLNRGSEQRNRRESQNGHPLNGRNGFDKSRGDHKNNAAKSVAEKTSSAQLLPTEAEQRWKSGLDWPVVLWIAIVHVLAVFAPFYFSWQGLVACVILIFMTGACGVCMGYHRCLTHGSFQKSGIRIWCTSTHPTCSKTR